MHEQGWKVSDWRTRKIYVFYMNNFSQSVSLLFLEWRESLVCIGPYGKDQIDKEIKDFGKVRILLTFK